MYKGPENFFKPDTISHEHYGAKPGSGDLSSFHINEKGEVVTVDDAGKVIYDEHKVIVEHGDKGLAWDRAEAEDDLLRTRDKKNNYQRNDPVNTAGKSKKSERENLKTTDDPKRQRNNRRIISEFMRKMN